MRRKRKLIIEHERVMHVACSICPEITQRRFSNTIEVVTI